MPQLSSPNYVRGHRPAKSAPVTPSYYPPYHLHDEDTPKAPIRASLPPVPKLSDEMVIGENDRDTIRQSAPSLAWNLCLSEGYINAVRTRLGGLLFRQFVIVTKKYELDAIDLWRAMIDISVLLVQDIDLLLEFNSFLPTGYRFEFQADGSVVQLSPDQQLLLSQSWDELGDSDVDASSRPASFTLLSRLSIIRSKEVLNEMHDEIEDLGGKVVKLTNEPSFHGTFSQVFKGRCNASQVAIKVLRSLPGVALHTMRRKTKRETVVWWTLFHPNIVPLLGFAEDIGDFGSLISPWYKNGNATEYIRRTRPSIRECLWLWHGVAKAIEYLHSESPPIVHGDLKPANILIDDMGMPRVCDFGLTRLLSQAGDSGLTTTSQFSGTARYLARELVGSEDPSPTTASDVHALGCIGYEFIYNTTPYFNCLATANPSRIYLAISSDAPPATQPRNAYYGELGILWDVFNSCWSLQPELRPQASLISQYSRECIERLVNELEMAA